MKKIFYFLIFIICNCVPQGVKLLDTDKFNKSFSGKLDEYYSYEFDDNMTPLYDYVGDKDSPLGSKFQNYKAVTNNKEKLTLLTEVSSFPKRGAIKIISPFDVYLTTNDNLHLIGKGYNVNKSVDNDILVGFPKGNSLSSFKSKEVISKNVSNKDMFPFWWFFILF